MEDKEAVSPVIGVILMVAVTVLLSSIVGVIVLGLGGQVNRNVQAGVDIDFEKDDDEVRVVFVQNRNAEYINVTLTGWGSRITV
ncbi:MAG: type IV pilin N-terminal domain-containing protein, partial [Halobacteria archaeon]|nr:type IV pilin N-terminal domain-containing protein [Halobacteria archaeon]